MVWAEANTGSTHVNQSYPWETTVPTLKKRFPDLSQLSIAILEHYVSPIMGDDAIKEIKSPLVEKELRDTLAAALLRSEKRFIKEYPNRAVSDAVLQLPLAELDSMSEAVQAFYERPTDTKLLNTIRERLTEDVPSLASEVVGDAAETYVTILRQELAASVPTARSQLVALATLDIEGNTTLIAERLERLIEVVTPGFAQPQIIGNIPPRPLLVVGREENLNGLKARLGIPMLDGRIDTTQPLTIVRGWPGVGKTTIVNLLAHEPEVAVAFPDGVLWVALGEKPNPLSELAAWGRALSIPDVGRTLDEAMRRMTAALRDKRMLLIVDDVYEVEHALAFRVAGKRSKTLFTTRFVDVASSLATTPDEIYLLPVLTDEKALELFGTLAPDTVKEHPEESKRLVRDLEGLPLAIQVAGRLLQAEFGLGWGVAELLKDIQEGAALLEAGAPADRADLANQTTPKVVALLKKSTDRLSEDNQLRFSFLGAFAPKPATFDISAMAAVWEVEDPKPTIRALVDRGLLERVGQRFQMHSLLVMHARSMLE